MGGKRDNRGRWKKGSRIAEVGRGIRRSEKADEKRHIGRGGKMEDREENGNRWRRRRKTREDR